MEIYINSKKKAYSFEFIENNFNLFDKDLKVKIIDGGKVIDECLLSDIFNFD